MSGRDPAAENAIRQAFLNEISGALDRLLEYYYGERMGYALLVFSFDPEKKGGDYTSNANREDMIQCLREMADQIEANQVIPPTIGNA